MNSETLRTLWRIHRTDHHALCAVCHLYIRQTWQVLGAE